MHNKWTHCEGSALLISLIVMSILLTLSLGVSELLISTLRDSKRSLDATQARYNAESALESALDTIENHAPGFETEQNKNSDDGSKKYQYAIKATAMQIPDKEKYEIKSEGDTYATLHFNESVTIPLFRGQNDEDNVRHFRVDYFLTPELALNNEYVSKDVDILRWKIFGIAKTGPTAGMMEVLNEFIPADQGNSPETPTCFGDSLQRTNCYNAAKFYERDLAPDGTVEYRVADCNSPTKACFPIEKFLNEHTQNFMVMTNTVNVDLIAGVLSTKEKQAIANIKYRVIEEDGQPLLTLPTIKITTDGFANDTKQSINMDLPRDTFLPVFNYALYRTVDAMVR